MTTETTTGKMPFREKFAYGFGDLASVLYWQTFMAYILFFYTDIFGITAAAAGTMTRSPSRSTEARPRATSCPLPTDGRSAVAVKVRRGG